MEENLNTPMEDVGTEEVENSKVDRVISIFEALNTEEQRMVFDKIWSMMQESAVPEDAPAIDEPMWWSMAWDPLDAIQERLSEW